MSPELPSVAFDDFEYLYFDGLYPPIIKMNNFKMVIDESLPTKKFGKTYIFLADFYFWHQIQDEAIQYDIIKKYIPDVKIVFMNPFNIDIGLRDNILGEEVEEMTNDHFFYLIQNLRFGNINKTQYESHGYIKEIHDKYKSDAHDEQFQEMFKFNFEFEEVYLVKKSVSMSKILSPLCFEYAVKESNSNLEMPWFCGEREERIDILYKKWETEGLNLFTNRFKKDLHRNRKFPKKIFLSRKDANSRYSTLIEDEIKTADPVGLVAARSFSEEHIFEDYFKRLGYTPVVMEELSYLDQINIFYNATHVAGLIGSGMLNTIFSKKLKYIFSIHVNSTYYFSYEYCSKMHNAEYVEIDFRSISNDNDKMMKILASIVERY
jgi:hypothetical protein